MVNQVIGDAVVDSACRWDDDEIAEAILTAQRIEEADPQAARQLRAQAQAARQHTQGRTREPYDPMRLYARVLRFYQGSITDERLETMDYRRFLGYVREADILSQDEARAYQSPQRESSDVSLVLNEFPKAQPYTGETVPLP